MLARDTSADADRYQQIAKLAQIRDQRERELAKTESELRSLIYNLDADE
jgi:hypothetical protein